MTYGIIFLLQLVAFSCFSFSIDDTGNVDLAQSDYLPVIRLLPAFQLELCLGSLAAGLNRRVGTAPVGAGG